MSTAAHHAPHGSAFDAISHALALEIAAVTRQEAARLVRVSNGVRRHAEAAGVVYDFFWAGGERPPEDTPVVGAFDGAQIRGQVVSAAGRRITVSLLADLGPCVPEGTLALDTAWLWSALQTQIDALRRGEVRGLRREFARLLTGEARPATAVPLLPAGVAAAPGLNAEQALALHRALHDQATCILGPPGTGKTRTLACILGRYHATGVSTLLCAPTNQAVDVGLARALQELEDAGQLEAALTAGHVVRVGPINDPELRQRYGDRIALDALVAARMPELAAERRRLASLGRTAPAEVRDRLVDFELRLKAAREEVLGQARIVAMTSHRASMPGQLARSFGAVVLDEAGMMNLPSACCAAARAERHLVVAGDPYQLRPIVTSAREEVQRWVRADPFRASGALAALERGAPPRWLVPLRVQHRCHSAIMAVLNACTYARTPLSAAEAVLARPPLPSPWGHAGVVLVDTSPLRPYAEFARPRGSRLNRVSAAAVRWALRELERAGVVSGEPGTPQVAVLTPFRAQCDLLRRHLAREAFGPGVRVSTVHRVQGAEHGVVVLDLVDGRGPGALSQFLRAREADDDGAALLNVAVSRARQLLIVVADVQYLRRHVPAGSVRRFLDYLDRHATRVLLPAACVRGAHAHALRRAG